MVIMDRRIATIASASMDTNKSPYIAMKRDSLRPSISANVWPLMWIVYGHAIPSVVRSARRHHPLNQES